MSKSDWKLVKLGNHVQQIRGVSYSPSDLSSELSNEYITLLRANNIQDTLIFDEVQYVHRSKVSEKQYIKQGDILICASSGSKHLVGKAAQATKDYDFCFGAFCKLIRPTQIESSYLGNYFKSNIYRNEISKLSRGANINNIKNEDIDNLIIPLPSIKEQRHIAATLDKANEMIVLRKKQLSELDTLAEAVFYELFGDPVKNERGWKLEHMTKFAEVTSSKRIFANEYIPEGIPFYRSKEIAELGSNRNISIELFISKK